MALKLLCVPHSLLWNIVVQMEDKDRNVTRVREILASVNLNIGRILIRVTHGGAFAPLGRVASDFAQGLKQLREASKQIDHLILFDTQNGRGVRLVAHFQDGRLANAARAIPEWGERCLATTSVGDRRSRPRTDACFLQTKAGYDSNLNLVSVSRAQPSLQ